MVTGLVSHGRQRQQRFQVPLHPLADGLGMPPEHGVHPLQALPLQVDIERREIICPRDRH